VSSGATRRIDCHEETRRCDFMAGSDFVVCGSMFWCMKNPVG
jgi:hypothetical protein